MKRLAKILAEVKEYGFDGVMPLYIEEEGEWSESYADFLIEFEEDEPDISERFIEFLEDELLDCQISAIGTEIEIIGPDFEDENADYYRGYMIEEFE